VEQLPTSSWCKLDQSCSTLKMTALTKRKTREANHRNRVLRKRKHESPRLGWKKGTARPRDGRTFLVEINPHESEIEHGKKKGSTKF